MAAKLVRTGTVHAGVSWRKPLAMVVNVQASGAGFRCVAPNLVASNVAMILFLAYVFIFDYPRQKILRRREIHNTRQMQSGSCRSRVVDLGYSAAPTNMASQCG